MYALYAALHTRLYVYDPIQNADALGGFTPMPTYPLGPGGGGNMCRPESSSTAGLPNHTSSTKWPPDIHPRYDSDG